MSMTPTPPRPDEGMRIAAKRIDALERLLACYRIGTRPSEKLMNDLAKSREAWDGVKP